MFRMRSILFMAFFGFLMLTIPISAFGSEQSLTDDPDSIIEADLDSIDLSEPFSQTFVYEDEYGIEHEYGLSFEPNYDNESDFQALGSSTNTATVGTWRSWYQGLTHHSYYYDLSKSGSQWRISNAREHKYSAPFTRFSNASLRISRSTSTSTFPAEINGGVDYVRFDTQWIGPLDSGRMTLRTTVSSKGTLTVRW
ncbi:hypothetical protein P4637_18105 [Halalkalibacterium halodurans]|uniref:hypothetical protein n=1 Tax=Halalkalibacterium halodurans TaxID=86665 RepID=UPI002E21C04A|nr:hypothetical protein [Halalkalibacterium halodurans]MED4086728.1 hypothetical protein [Halalkalibacterium halodurans]MED4105588.1 hypothetical protein [Halalkalibacterium halodurans]MED4110581.1 hypothetical protein [Halalkalibacterium halodurans]MED4124870.1 hypothetical protein [Halalkalibacterium halodurans]